MGPFGANEMLADMTVECGVDGDEMEAEKKRWLRAGREGLSR